MIHFLTRFLNKKTLRNPPATFRVLMLMLAICLYGTTGFLYFELPLNPDLTWLDGFWYTLVTIATVGYGDFFPKSWGGRFVVGTPIMIFGIGLLGYALSLVATTLVAAKTKEIKGMASFHLKDHLIVFNYSGLAKVERVLGELALDDSIDIDAIVLVDEHLEELPSELQKKGIHFVRGNPTRDETLQRAGIDRALHAVLLTRNPTDLASDNLNVAIALAIEGRNRRVNTVVECIDPASEELLRKAGCDRIVCSSRFDAHFISQELLNPGIQEVLDDLLTAGHGHQLYLVPLTAAAKVQDLILRCKEQGHLLVGVSSSERRIQFNPPADTQLAAGVRVITIGRSRIEQL